MTRNNFKLKVSREDGPVNISGYVDNDRSVIIEEPEIGGDSVIFYNVEVINNTGDMGFNLWACVLDDDGAFSPYMAEGLNRVAVGYNEDYVALINVGNFGSKQFNVINGSRSGKWIQMNGDGSITVS